MTKEELLKPRWKLIAGFPGCLFRVPEILKEGLVSWKSVDGEECFKYKGEYIYPQLYPHLFRKLEWWEDRQEKDLPKYLRYEGCDFFRLSYPAKGTIVKVESYSDDCVNYIYPMDTFICDWITLYEPATEEEFLNQNKC